LLPERSQTKEVEPVNGHPRAAMIEIDDEACVIHFRGQRLDLTRYEYRLLRVLALRPGRVYSRDALMSAVWEDPGASMDRTVDAHIKTLRAKLRAVDEATNPIVTHRGMGYSWSTAL
jgi:two-component system catabolic regulation response regulator CreB